MTDAVKFSGVEFLSPRKLAPTELVLAGTPISTRCVAARSIATGVPAMPAGAVTFNNVSDSFSGAFTGNGGGLTNVNAATLGGLAPASFWQLGGNNVAGGQFLGSVNNQPLELWADGARALRLEPNSGGAPNVIGGSANNLVDAGVGGAFIGGGSNNSIEYDSPFGASSPGSAIGGGYNNLIEAGSPASTIAGGSNNAIPLIVSFSGSARPAAPSVAAMITIFHSTRQTPPSAAAPATPSSAPPPR